jgi:hypothetical protein
MYPTVCRIYYKYIGKKIRVKITEAAAIRERNHGTVITLTGQLATFALEFWYFALVNILFHFLDFELFKKVSPILKHLEVVLVLLVLIYNFPLLISYYIKFVIVKSKC